MSLHKIPNGNGVIVADEVHSAVHEGRFFTAVAFDAAVANAANLDFGITVPTGFSMHLRPAGTSDSDFDLFLYENSIFSGGTAAPGINRRRDLPNDPHITNVINPTVTNVGDLIARDRLYGGGFFGASDDIGTFSEWILTPGTYLARGTNDAGGAAGLLLRLNYYTAPAPS